MKTQLFLTRTLSLLPIFFISFQLLHAQEIGLELYSVRNQLKADVPGTLAKIKSWNIHEIEGGGTYGLPMDEYKKLLQQNGLKMISVAADFDALSKDPQPAIDEAKDFGAMYIVCFWIPHNGDEFTIDDMKKAVSGMLSPILREEYIGNAEIRQVFNITKFGKIAGCYVTKGIIKRGAGVRLIRDNIVIHEGKLKTLRRFKDDVKEVKEGN